MDNSTKMDKIAFFKFLRIYCAKQNCICFKEFDCIWFKEFATKTN